MPDRRNQSNLLSGGIQKAWEATWKNLFPDSAKFPIFVLWVVSSVGLEYMLDRHGVGSSNLPRPTRKRGELDGCRAPFLIFECKSKVSSCCDFSYLSFSH
jgi:hypothetical protein